MKKPATETSDNKIFKIKKMRVSDRKILKHWTGVLTKILSTETKEKP